MPIESCLRIGCAAGFTLLAAVLFPTPLGGQPPGDVVASIKHSSPDSRRGGIEFLPGGRFRSANMPLVMVLGIAYGIPTQSIESIRLRIRGIPDWMLTEPYDIEAKAAGPAPAGATAKQRNQRIRLMLQSVLADRLQLALRRETQVMPVYALMIGKHGPALAKATITEQECAESAPFGSPSPAGPGCHQFAGGIGRGLRGSAVDMSDLALYVSNWSDLPVVDRTGLAGLYAIQTPGWASIYMNDPARPSLDEVFDRLGLKLVRTTAPVEVLVVEHAQRPSAN